MIPVGILVITILWIALMTYMWMQNILFFMNKRGSGIWMRIGIVLLSLTLTVSTAFILLAIDKALYARGMFMAPVSVVAASAVYIVLIAGYVILWIRNWRKKEDQIERMTAVMVLIAVVVVETLLIINIDMTLYEMYMRSISAR